MFKHISHLLKTFCPALILIFIYSHCTTHKESFIKEDSLLLSDSLLHRLNIDTVQGSANANQIEVTGKITPDEDKVIRIFPMVSGIVSNIHVQVGDVVKPGQVLASMRSVEVATIHRDVSSSGADMATAKRNMQAADDMYKSGLMSERDLTQSRNEYKKAVAENQRSKQVLQINGNGQLSNYTVKSPIGGFVIEKKVTNNIQLRADNSENMFAIADLSSVWVIINVYESDINKIRTGDKVDITPISYPDKIFEGEIDKVYNMLDPDNKVMRARIKIKNPGYLLKPEMFATVKVHIQADGSLPSINNNSLIFDNEKYYVILLDSKNKPRIQQISIAKKIEDRVYIQNGVQAGDRVVASRQLYIYEALKNN